MKNISILSIVFFVALGSVVGSAQSKEMAAGMIQDHLLSAKERQETRKTMDPSLYSAQPFIARTYEIAREIPEILDKQFCYCYCETNPKFKHKSLLSCYVDDHASNCGTCMRQAITSLEMTRAGKTPREIAKHFRAKYAGAHEGHNH